jgi:hypothetical protein
MASTNEHPRNLGEAYPPVLSSVLSVVMGTENIRTSKMGFETSNGGLEFLRRMKFRHPTMGMLQIGIRSWLQHLDCLGSWTSCVKTIIKEI